MSDWLPSDHPIFGLFARVGRGVKISQHAHILGVPNIEIGDNVRIDIGARLFAGKGFIKIGSHVHIATGVLLLGAGGVTIGDGCAIGFDGKLISASDSFSGEWLIGPTFPAELTKVRRAPIAMRRLSVLGSGCTVLPGVTMAEGSVAGACSLLREDTASWSTYAGVPAKKIATRSREALEKFVKWEQEWQLRT